MLSPEIIRTAMEMRDRGIEYRTIAQELNVPVGTISSAITRYRAGIKNELHRCRNCGKPLIHCSIRRKYCCNVCRYQWNNRNAHKPIRANAEVKKCQSCGQVFRAYKSAHRKFCSVDCALDHRYGKIVASV